jgi:hypothetical protein
MSKSNYDLAVKLHRNGFNVIPCDTNKKPLVSKWTSQRLDENALKPYTWDLIGLSISQSQLPLECIDFDLKHDSKGTIFEEFKSKLNNAELFNRLFVQQTMSGGYHLVYQLEKDIPRGNEKLARRADSTEAIIETRGLGGYFALYPDKFIQLDLLNLPVITVEERNLLIQIARDLDESTAGTATPIDIGPTGNSGRSLSSPAALIKSPLDLYNQSLTIHDCLRISEAMGWSYCGENNQGSLIARPGKDPNEGHSAVINKDTLVVVNWSSSVDLPTDEGMSFAKFHAL